jgi:hypothetical protein
VLVHARLLIQTAVRDQLMARVFSVKDTLHSWAFGVAFISAGTVIALLGTRELFVIAGGAALLVLAVAAPALRRPWGAERVPLEPAPPEPAMLESIR